MRHAPGPVRARVPRQNEPFLLHDVFVTHTIQAIRNPEELARV